ncbi:MAG TPA: hypothetical protein VHR66_24030 [Gemmataceae bacterium]|nr:hypothetical protein [Gemmataceae bacterium]
MRMTSGLLVCALMLMGASSVVADEKSGTDAEGFIQQWLVLAPIPLKDGEDGAAGLGREAIADEAKLKPKAGDKVKAGDRELGWKAHVAKSFFVDFNAILGAQTEDAIGYAVTYITVADDMTVKMKTGSDDQCKVWLNGKEVLKVTDARPSEKDQDTTEVTLKKGVNVLVAKVVNEKIDWQFCVRFVDKDDKPVAGLMAKASE